MNGPLYRRLDEHPRTPVHAALSRDRQRERERVSERYHISPLLFIFTLGALALCFYLSFVGAAGAVDAEKEQRKTPKSGGKSIGQQTGLLLWCSFPSQCWWMWTCPSPPAGHTEIIVRCVKCRVLILQSCAVKNIKTLNKFQCVRVESAQRWKAGCQNQNGKLPDVQWRAKVFALARDCACRHWWLLKLFCFNTLSMEAWNYYYYYYIIKIGISHF